MQEYRVTAGGQTYELPLPFLVFATQNPIEQEGTYPLPEAQLDRFMFQVDVGYPSEEEEVRIVNQMTTAYRPTLRKVLSPRAHPRAAGAGAAGAGGAARRRARGRALPRHPPGRAHRRPSSSASTSSWGAGPRASQYLVLAAKARAILDGRYAAAIEDVRALAVPVLVAPRAAELPRRGRRHGAHALVDRLVDAIRPA